MLVKCQDDERLNEWYSISGNKDIISQTVMRWSPENGLIYETRDNIYQRRYNLQGLDLKWATVWRMPESYVRIKSKDHMAMYKSIFFTLAKHMNFSTLNYVRDTHYGSYDKYTKKWSGILGRLQSGEVDIAVADISMTKDRMDAFDFTGPLIFSRTKLYIRQPGSFTIQWNAYLKAFDRSIWMLIIGVIVVSGILLTYMQAKVRKVYCVHNHLIENHLNVWGIYCQQGLTEFPQPASLRIAYVSIFFSAIILSAIYSASIISYLTILSPTLPFHSLTEFANHGGMDLIVLRDSAEYDVIKNSHSKIIIKLRRLMKKYSDLPNDDVEAFERVCHENVAYYTNDAIAQMMQEFIDCEIIGISTDRVDNIAFALTKNNPFTEFISYNILRFQDLGIWQRLKSRYFQKQQLLEKNYNAVEFRGITPLIVILIFGVISSFSVLLIEKFYHRLTHMFSIDNRMSGCPRMLYQRYSS